MACRPAGSAGEGGAAAPRVGPLTLHDAQARPDYTWMI
jgi:hypothetical protein